MNRRGFLRGLLGTAAVVAADPEALAKALWTPKKTIFIPKLLLDPEVIRLKAVVAQINYSIFDVEHTYSQGGFAFLQARDLRDCVDRVLIEHDKNLWRANPIVCVNEVEYDAMQRALKPPGFFASLRNKVAEAFDIPEEQLGLDDYDDGSSEEY